MFFKISKIFVLLKKHLKNRVSEKAAKRRPGSRATTTLVGWPGQGVRHGPIGCSARHIGGLLDGAPALVAPSGRRNQIRTARVRRDLLISALSTN